MLAVSYTYLYIVLPFYQSILPLDDFQSKLQISVSFPTHPNISACTLTRVQYLFMFFKVYTAKDTYIFRNANTCVTQTALEIDNIVITPESSSMPLPWQCPS